MTALVDPYGQAVERRPMAVTLSGGLLARHRGGAVLGLDAASLGTTWPLAATAPTVARADMGEGEEPEPPEVEIAAGVGVLAIEGPLAQREESSWCGLIQGYDGIAKRIKGALDDSQIGALVLRVNSPGGDAAGLAEAVRQIRADVARAGKPVLVQADESMGSAAVYLCLSVATAGVFLPPAGRVGSIGTIAMLYSEARALDAAGVDVELVCDPPGKSAGYSQIPIGDTARERTRALVRAFTEEFVQAVATARGVAPEKIRALDAAMLRGADAVTAGLADGVQGLPETIALAARLVRAGRASQAASGAKAPPAKVAGLTRGSKSMADQSLVCALVGLAADATEAQVVDRLRSLAAFEAEAVRLSGEADSGKALGALRAAVERAAKAADIEAKAVASRVDNLLAAAQSGPRPRITPAEVPDLRAWGLANADGLEAYLAKRAPTVPETQVEPKPSAVEADGPETHGGKVWADMSNAERVALSREDKGKADRMRAASKVFGAHAGKKG